MFWLLFRAMILAAIGGFIVLIAMIAMGPIVDVMFSFTTNENSRNAYWAEQAVTWLPGIVAGGIVIKVLAGAAVRRGAI